MKNEVISKQAIRQVLKEYFGQYKKYSFWALIAFLLPAIGSVFVAFVPPLIIGKLINIFIAQNKISLNNVGLYIGLFGGFWLLGEFFWRIGLHFIVKLQEKGIGNLQKSAFKRLSERDYNFYANNFVGSITKRTFAFSRSFETFTDTLVFNVTNNIFPLIFVVIVLWGYSFWIPMTLIFFLIVAVFAAWPIMKKRSKLVALRHDAGSRISGRLSDAMTNILAVKSFAKENEEAVSYGEYSNDFTAKFKNAANYHNLKFDTKIAPLYVLTNVIGLTLAIFFAQRFGLPAGTVVIVFSYYSQTTRIFWEINKTYRNIESSIGEAAEFTQMFLNPPEVENAPDAQVLKVSDAIISFNDVNFHYESKRAGVISFLDDFNLKINSNEKVGLVGPSGGGKTTITKLLLRFIDLQSGSITIDGQDISKVTQNSLRKMIAYVPQESLLFHRTLFENIAYGKENATKEEVMEAARIAHADEFINNLPLGYDTLVGERGIKLSGGQRQRVAIARALLKNAPILLLDEATSSLDSESEKYIQEGLWELMKDKTALVIAHRLSTIKHLDRIIVLDQGKIVEDGTHNELIKKQGLYARLWVHQSGEFL